MTNGPSVVKPMQAFLHHVHMLCDAIEWRLTHFLPCECDQAGKNPFKYFVTAGI